MNTEIESVPNDAVLSRRILRVLTDRGRRMVYLAGLSIPFNLAMAGWKLILLFVTPSLFLFANVVFACGVAGAKVLAIRSHSDSPGRFRSLDRQDPRRSYRLIGIILLTLSALYTLSNVPTLIWGGTATRYEEPVAIIIATVTFTELGVSIHGVWSARRDKDLLIEAIKWTNLASSFVLVAFTQSAIMSFTTAEDPSRYSAITGVILGGSATVIGLYMTLRRHRA